MDTEVNELLVRVKRLERQNRRHRRLGTVAVGLACAALAWSAQAKPEIPEIPEVIEAQPHPGRARRLATGRQSPGPLSSVHTCGQGRG